MKKTTIIFFVSLINFAVSKNAHCQTYTTERKSCGSCGKEVSIYSTVGMSCPHCGVEWGKENTTTDYSRRYRDDYYDSYSSYPRIGYVYTKTNVRWGPGKNYAIKDVLTDFTTITINKRVGSWYYVSYKKFNGWYEEEYNGYIYKSLVN